MKSTDIRATIKKAILSSGQSIPQIAKSAGISPCTLSNYLRGDSNMGFNNLVKVLKVLKISVKL
jgi:transcriptional regulator with XRE-family HTH domain